MKILVEVRSVCRRLVDNGWNELFRKHGLDLEAAIGLGDDAFAERLAGPLVVDRGVPGFADFTTAGSKAIEAGKPAASLLYHAMASPSVHPDGSDLPGDPETYPTLAELDTVENYIYSLNKIDLSGLENPVIAVSIQANQVACVVAVPHERIDVDIEPVDDTNAALAMDTLQLLVPVKLAEPE